MAVQMHSMGMIKALLEAEMVWRAQYGVRNKVGRQMG
jgi:hypothetical protein